LSESENKYNSAQMRLELGKHVMLYLEGNYNAFALVTTSQIRTQREKGKQPI
jgi:hypothetical protein